MQPGLGSVMTIGSPVQLIQPNISITPKPAGAPSNSSPKPIPMPAVTINPVDASTLQKKNILIKNPPNMTFKSLPSPENVKPFTGKIVRLSSPVITANPASIAALHKTTHPDVEITSVSRQGERLFLNAIIKLFIALYYKQLSEDIKMYSYKIKTNFDSPGMLNGE